MQYFIVFVVGAMLLGAGAMLSPAWPTRQPRIGTASIFTLALIVGGAVFWAELFGWDTLVIDYLLFALVSIVVLGGTFSQAQERAEDRGEELLDADQGWPGPEDLAFFGVAALVCVIPLSVFYLPGGTLAIEHAAMTLAAREGGTFTSLAPFFPDVTVQSAPGFHALTAYLSQQLRQSIPMVHMAVSSVLMLLTVWASYDLGAELRDKRLGRACAIAALVLAWWLVVFMEGYFAWLMALVFGMAYLLYLVRYQRHQTWLDMVGAGLMLGAALYTHVGVFVGLLIAHVLFVLLHLRLPATAEKRTPDYRQRSSIKRLAGLLIGIPGIALLGTAPWWLNNLSLVEALIWQAIQTPGVPAPNLWFYLLLPPAIIARFLDMRNRLYAWVMFWWLFAELLPGAGAAVMLPGILLVGDGLLWLYNLLPQRIRTLSRQYVYGLIVIGGGALLAFNVSLSQQMLAFLDMSASPDDVAVLREFALYAPDDARLYNPPETPWALPLAERAVSNFSPENPQLTGNLPADRFSVPDTATHYYLPDGASLPVDPSELNLNAAYSQGDAVIYAMIREDSAGSE
jgi:hypothetical protein